MAQRQHHAHQHHHHHHRLHQQQEQQQQQMCALLLDFLEVAVHVILHARAVYPPEMFELRSKYQVPVHVSRAPVLNE
jgi:hypothetical protein